MGQFMYLKPGQRSAVKMYLKCIFGVKLAKKLFSNKNFRVDPWSGNEKHKIYPALPLQRILVSINRHNVGP